MGSDTIADTSPYLYLATFFFALSALSSDLLFIRLALTCGFFFLVLSALSGFSKNGSFKNLPLADGTIDVPMFINLVLFLLNAFICARLLRDEQGPNKHWNEQERALFRFFQARCNVTPLEFQSILQNGRFVALPPHTEVPHTQDTLYLVCEGKVQCKAKFHHEFFGKSFVKRSGQFFDIKLFNLFSLPVGFDNLEFHAKTLTACQLFAWNLDGLVAMRELQSPCLWLYWEYIVLRALTGVAIRHHLKANDTLYDALLIPEDPSWLEGAPSRDFADKQAGDDNKKKSKAGGCWREHAQRQCKIMRDAFGHIIPPHGIRHRPGCQHINPKQAQLENECRAKAVSSSATPFSFLTKSGDSKDGAEQQSKVAVPMIWRKD